MISSSFLSNYFVLDYSLLRSFSLFLLSSYLSLESAELADLVWVTGFTLTLERYETIGECIASSPWGFGLEFGLSKK